MNLIDAIVKFEKALEHMGACVGLPQIDEPIRALAAAENVLLEHILALEGFDMGTDATEHLRSGGATEGVTYKGITYAAGWDGTHGEPVVIRLCRIRDARDVVELNQLYGRVPDHDPGTIARGA